MRNDSIVYEKSFKFAKRIIKLYKFLVYEKKERVISHQIMKSGTSIGANISEATYAQSRKDFINKKKFEKYLIYSIPILLLVVILER